jgi:hypothetical protein
MTKRRNTGNPGAHLSAGGPSEGGLPEGGRHDDLEPDLRAALETIGAAWSVSQQKQPPRLVDQAVLNAAGRALDQPARQRKRQSIRLPIRWISAFATAAGVLLAVTIVIERGRDAPAPPVTTPDGYEAQRSVAAPKLAAEADREPAQSLTAAAIAENAAPAADAPSSLAQPLGEEPPADAEAWIERLRKVKARGDLATFQAQLAAFRMAYPDYPLPPELLE